MKFHPHAFEKSLPSLMKEQKVQGYLFHGPDEGRVQYLASLIAKSTRMNTEAVNATSILSGEVHLQDRLQSVSLFGDQSLILIHEATDRLTKAIQNLSLEQEGNPFVILAGALTGKSSLKKHFEAHERLVSVACYVEDVQQRRQSLEHLLQMEGLRVESDTLTYLSQHLHGDFMQMKQEIVKLALYHGQERDYLSLEDAQAVLAHEELIESEWLLEAILSRHQGKINGLLAQLAANQSPAVATIRGLTYQCLRLLHVRELVDESVPIDRAMSQCRPPFFFKQQPIVKRYLPKWDQTQLKHLLSALYQAEKQSKQYGSLSFAVFERLLLHATQVKPGARAA